MVRFGKVWRGRHGKVWPVMARSVEVRSGMEWQARYVLVCRGEARQGMAWQGEERKKEEL